MTDYYLHGFSVDEIDGIQVQILVGKSARLVETYLPRDRAWKLLHSLAGALEASQ